MKDTSHSGFWITVLIFVCFACQEKKEPVTTPMVDINATAKHEAFIPNPQDIPKQEVHTLPINAPAPDFLLPGIDGRMYTLQDFDDAKVLVIIFTCNHCPTAQAYEDRIIELVDDYKQEDVRIVAISPNSVKALLLEEMGYSDLGDSFEEMKIRAQTKGFNFVYLYDGDTQKASIQYGPKATPQAFVFGKDRKLKYTGRLDDSEKPGTGHADDLRAAIDAVLLDVDILEPVKKNFGCSVKWGWKTAWTNKVNNDWDKLPVKLDEISEGGVRILMHNDSERLWLINVWATWCGPCTIEFPELIKIHRMYIGRDFEFISVSADKIERKDRVLHFLQRQHAAIKNYIFIGERTYDLMSAIDPKWDGTLPYTILLAPGGEIVYKKAGPIDPLVLKRAIVNHPLIGRYY